jgi:hypothetical protein
MIEGKSQIFIVTITILIITVIHLDTFIFLRQCTHWKITEIPAHFKKVS